MSERRLAAIMFTDIVGYTALMGENEQKALQLLEKNRKIQKPLIEMYHGQFLKEMGDGMLASFTSVSDAVHCAQQILRVSKEEPELKLHIGIHLGEVVFSDGDVFGDGVNIASRIESSAKEGEIYISEDVWKNIKNKEDLPVEFMGKKTFKNVKESVGLYKLKGEHAREKTPSNIPKARSLSSRQIGLIATVIALFFIAFFVLFEYVLKEKKPAGIHDKSIAILPFRNDSPDPDNEYFCNGMEEEIRIQLLNIADLKIESRQSVEKYRQNPEKDVTTIGAELGVVYIVEGSVRKNGDDVRVTVQLIDAKTGDSMWGDTYDGDYTGKLLTFQSHTAKQIASTLKITITPEEERRIESLPTHDIRAYDYFIKGTHELNKYWTSRNIEFAKESIKLFDKALTIDPHFEQALDGKGTAFLGLEQYDSAKYYASRILKINPDSQHGYRLLGGYYKFTQNYDSAIENYKLAIKYSPENSLIENVSESHIGYIYCNNKNDFQRGLVYLHKGFDLKADDLWADYIQLGTTFLHIGDYMRADKYYRKMFEFETSNMGIMVFSRALQAQSKYKEALNLLDTTCTQESDIMCNQLRFYTYISMKEFDQAEKYYNQFLSTGGTPGVWDSIELAYLKKETGEKQLSQTILKNCRDSMEKQLIENETFWIYLSLSSIHAIMDENEKALEYLTKGNDFKISWGWHDYLAIYPIFENLWDDPEFKTIVKRAQDEKAVIRAQVQEMIDSGEIDL